MREAALTNQTVSVIGASNGQFGAMWAQADLRKILGIAGARVVGDELPVARASEKFDARAACSTPSSSSGSGSCSRRSHPAADPAV